MSETTAHLTTGISTTEAAAKLNAKKPEAQQADGNPPADKAKKGAKETSAKEPENKQANPTEEDNKGQPAPKSKGKDTQAEPEAEDDTDDQPEGAQDANDEGQDDPEGDEGDEDAGADEGEDGDEYGEDLHTVVVDGKEVQVTYDELLAGYSREADYRKKTAQLAKDRKEVDAIREEVKDLPQVKKRYDASATRFANHAGAVIAALDKFFMPQEPAEGLRDTDPKAYMAQKEQRQQAIDFKAALQHELNGIEGHQKAENAKLVKEGRTKLWEMHPDFSPTHERGTANRNKLREYALKHGFTDEAIANEPNPALFSWAIKAMRYDELMANKAKARPKQPVSKVVKNSKAPADHKATKHRQVTEAKNAHASSGSIGSAAAAISAIRNKR